VEGERAGRRRAPVHPRKAPEELEVHFPDNGPDPRVDVAAPPQRVEAVDGVQAAHLPRIEDPDYRTRLTDHGGMADSEQAVVEAPRVEAMILGISRSAGSWMMRLESVTHSCAVSSHVFPPHGN